MAADNKDTIYVDIDDDITAVIDKVTDSKAKIVALVLPKRATAMQSQVNMKLLKRAADDAGKNLVLITGESGLMPLAAAAGVYVAKTPSSKPEIPAGAPIADDEIDDIDENAPNEPEDKFDARADENKPIGEVAGLGAAALGSLPDDDTIELDNSEVPAPLPPAVKKPKKGKDKKKRIPDFGRFRNRALIAILILIGLGVLIYFALEVWPHATIKIYTSQTSIPASFTASLDSNATKVDPVNEILPAVAQTIQKNYSQTVPASGQKDEGTPATGTVTMSAQECGSNIGQAPDVPSGTGVSTNNLTYITQSDTSFSYNKFANGCVYFTADNATPITAQSPGTNYNVSSATFSVSGRSDVSGTGSASGGTSNVVRVVQQSDIDAAKQKLQSQDDSAIKQMLQSKLSQENLTAIPQTFAALPSDVQSSNNAGDQADNVTVTESVTYVMFGYRTSDMQQLIEANVANQIDTATQGILNYGLGNASYKLTGAPTTSTANVGISTTVIVGPKLNAAAIKKQAAGKKAGDIRNEYEGRKGVSKVEVDLSPFWVGSVPNDTSKIKIEFVKTSNG